MVRYLTMEMETMATPTRMSRVAYRAGSRIRQARAVPARVPTCPDDGEEVGTCRVTPPLSEKIRSPGEYCDELESMYWRH